MRKKIFKKYVNIPITEQMDKEIERLVGKMQKIQPGFNKTLWARSVLQKEIVRRRKNGELKQLIVE